MLHITQPTLSRQIMELEEELGCKLLIRGNRKISLTEDGMFLKKRAEEISSLFDMTLLEFDSVKDIISGDIYFGGGESEAMSFHPLHNSPDLYCLYQLLLCYEKKSTYDEAWEKIDSYHQNFINGQGGYPANFDNTKSKYRPLIDLITICDCLDAATDFYSRNYQRAKSLDQVIEEFKEGALVRYNPDFVNILAKNSKLKDTLADIICNRRGEIYYTIYKIYIGK